MGLVLDPLLVATANGRAHSPYQTFRWNTGGTAYEFATGVWTDQSYSDPSWLTAIAGSKVSGNISGNAATATLAASATALANGRTIAITGDLAYTSPAFDGTGNVTAAGTLATVNANVGTFGDATHVPAVTVNAKGLVTAVSSTAITAPTAANPTASVGLTAVNGSASTFLRSDGAPALDQSIAPTWTGQHTFNLPVLVPGTSDATGRILLRNRLTFQGVLAAKAAFLAENHYYDGTNDLRIDTTSPAARIIIRNDGASGSLAGTFNFERVAAGANPITWTSLLRIDDTGGATFTSSNANALTVGPNGTTNPAFNVVTNVSSAATGLSVTGNAAGSGVTLTALGGTNEDISLVPKGTGAVKVPAGAQASPSIKFGSTSGLYGSGFGVYFTYNSNGTYAGFDGNGVTASSAAGFAFSSTTAATGTVDGGLFRLAPKVGQFGDGGQNANGWLVDQGSPHRVTTQVDATTTTLATVTGTSTAVIAGRSYTIRGELPITADATGGYKLALSGTATATAVWYDVTVITEGSPATVERSARKTSLGSSHSGTLGTAVKAVVTGEITVNAAGTILAQFAQAAANGTSSVLVGSWLELRDTGS